jgi:uncharacterized membrane protein
MKRLVGIAIGLVALGVYAPALAGMPNFTVSDTASLRLSGISFFVILLFLTAWGFRHLWNYVRRDFSALPYLTYKRALAFVLLLGLLLNVVLLMIAGTRELMTPGAWEKSGVSYKLKGGEPGSQRR